MINGAVKPGPQPVFALSDGTDVFAAPPFFITGSGRCGTTLMRRLLIEQTGVVIPQENYTLADSARWKALARTDWPACCSAVVEHLARSGAGLANFGLEQRELLDLLNSVPPDRRTLPNLWHAFHAIYAAKAGLAGANRWGDKTPLNARKVGRIVEIFPEARFVFMFRDVFDVAYSYGSMSALARKGRYLEGATRWVDANRHLLNFCSRHPHAACIVRYEDLVEAADETVARVTAFLGLERSPRALSSAEARDMVTQSHLRKVTTEVDRSSVGAGRANLSAADKSVIAEQAAALQVALGYETSGIEASPVLHAFDRQRLGTHLAR